MNNQKIIIYSLLPRLWGNQVNNPQSNGDININGVGKLHDITAEDLAYIKGLGATHLWLIGLIDHATATSFPHFSADPQEVVKGIAGSPYAIRDYYNIAPELLDEGEDAFQVFDALLERIHQVGLKLLIDFIPNHVARTYCSRVAPSDVVSLGVEDNKELAFSTENNFYYFPNSSLRLPVVGCYQESPARATGNDCFTPSPSVNDWYETVKLNYGVDYLGGRTSFDPIPDTWYKMLEILNYWTRKGVDGFRCDMAELVPESFWSWAIPQIKKNFPEQLFLAEIYQPHRYQSFLDAGFDYLYDKVGMYDASRAVIERSAPARWLDIAREATNNQEQMCYFLENHDEQRIASDFFAHKAHYAIPSLATLLLQGKNPFLLYFGQEIGERGMDKEGFSGLDGRTTIFDYWAISSIQRLRQGQLFPEEQALLSQYQKLCAEVAHLPIIVSGGYYGLNYANEEKEDFASSTYAFLRYSFGEILLVVANHSEGYLRQRIRIPQEAIDIIGIQSNTPLAYRELITEVEGITTLTWQAPVVIELQPWSVVLIHYHTL